MTTTVETVTRTSTAPGRAGRITGVVLTAGLTLFCLSDAVTKLLSVPGVVEATSRLGFPPETVPVIGATLLVCVALYLVPRTSILGAVLLTGYLGGAVCSQLRIEAPLFSTMLFPVYFGILVWVALYLRNAQVREIVRGMATGR